MAGSSPGAGAAAQRPIHPVTITIDAGHPGPVIPGDFAGLSFERGPLGPGTAGLTGGLFRTENTTMLTLFRNLGMTSLRVGGGTVDQLIPAGTGPDGFTGIDEHVRLRRGGRNQGHLHAAPAQPRRPTRSVTCSRSMPGWPGTSGSTTRRTWPASPSATSRTGMTSTPGPGTSSTRRSTRKSTARRAAPTRPTWRTGRASPTRSGRRRRARRCRGRTSARTTG